MGTRGFLIVWVLAATLASRAAPGAPVRVTTPNFEIYTVENEASALDALRHFEQVRAFFESSAGPLRPPAGPVSIVAFDSVAEYRAHSPLPFTTAHFQAAGDHGFIVVSDLRAASYSAAVHELVHRFARASALKLPPWLEEGLAEFYSTLRPLGDGRMEVGEPPLGRVQTLARRLPIELDELLAADRGSTYLTELEPGRLYYAESWVLTHMLAVSARYSGGFAKFLALAAGGKDSEAAMKEAFGRSFGDMRSDLGDYVRRGRFNSRTVVYGARVPPPVVRPMSAYYWAAALADLRAAGRDNWEGIREAYQTLAGAFPDRPEPLVTLAKRALQSGRVEEARSWFAGALDRGSTDVTVYVEYSDLMAGEGSGPDRARLLRRAVELKPEDEDIQRRLSLALYESLDYVEARRWMLKIRQVQPEHAAEFYRVLAYLDEQLGLEEEARSAATRAVALARNSEEADHSRNLLDFVTRAAPPLPSRESERTPVTPPEAEVRVSTPPSLPQPAPAKRPGVPLYPLQGDLLAVDCYGRAAVFWIRTPKEKVGFEVADLQKLTVLRGGAQVLRYFPCGAQKPERVVVRYELRRNPVYSTRGIARVVEFSR